MLTVRDAATAADFYSRALGAVELSRTVGPGDRAVIELAVDGLRFFVVDENREAFNLSPSSLGGTSVRINLIVDDPDAAGRRFREAGGEEIFPIGDQPYGFRQGRFGDPDGHHWLLGKPL
jgi:PhnB protein